MRETFRQWRRVFPGEGTDDLINIYEKGTRGPYKPNDEDEATRHSSPVPFGPRQADLLFLVGPGGAIHPRCCRRGVASGAGHIPSPPPRARPLRAAKTDLLKPSLS